jgi:hypothetical protein
LRWQAPSFDCKRLELALGLGPKGLENRCRVLTVSLLPQADRICVGLLTLAWDVDTVDPRTIEAENLGLKLRGQLRIAVRLEKLGRNLEGAKGLNLVLRRAIPDRIRSLENVVLRDVQEQFP